MAESKREYVVARGILISGGKNNGIGETVKLTDEQAERLLEQGVIEEKSEYKKAEKTEVKSPERGSEPDPKDEGSDGEVTEEVDEIDLDSLTHEQLDDLALNQLEIPKDAYPKSGDLKKKRDAIQKYADEHGLSE